MEGQECDEVKIHGGGESALDAAVTNTCQT